MTPKAKRREKWLRELEQFTVELDPRFAGRIPWDAAMFHFNQGSSPGLAALKIVSSESPRGDSVPSTARVVSDGKW